MPGPVSRDSISKCTPGNDLYAMIRSPGAKLPSQQKSAKVDSIHSLKAQMEREAVARLGKVSQNLIFVARAGKYLFLAIAIPPYILLYGLPKWMIVDLLPVLFHFSFKPFKIFNEKMKDLFKINENDKGIMAGIKNAWAAASTKAAEYIKWIDRASQALFVHLKHQIVAMASRLLQPYMPLLKNSMDAAEMATKMLFQKAFEKGDKQAALAREFVSLAWKTAKQEFFNQVRPFVEMIKNQAKKFRTQAKKIIEKPRLEIQKFKTNVTQRLKRTNEVIKSTSLKISKTLEAAVTTTVSYVARPVIEWVAPKIQWTMSNLQYGSEKILQNFEKIRSFVQNLASGAMDVARNSRQAVITIVKNVFEVAIPSFVKHFFNPEGGFKKKYQEMFQNLGKKLNKIKNSSYQFAIDRLEATKKHFFSFLRKTRDFLKFLGQQIKLMPQRIFKLVIKSYQVVVQSSIKTVHFIRWVGVLTRVLARLAWQEFLDMTTWIAKVSRINKSS